MRTTYLILSFILGGLLYGNAQETLSSYKYIIVPTKFNSFKKENQYQTSTMVKYHLVNRGFNAVYTNALPMEVSANRCMAATAVLIDESNMFTIKVHISFQDCNAVEVYRTATASSKIKEFKAAYKEAIERSFQSLDGYTYEYKPAESETPIVVNFGDDVKTLEPDPVSSAPVEKEVKEVPEAPVTPEKEIKESVTPVIQEKEEAVQEIVPAKPAVSDSSLWYAQEIPNGFQLVDSSPKVRLRIYQSQKEGVFLAKGDDIQGIVYEEQGSWYFDYYQGGKLIHQLLNIKF
ncbi:MAG: hypothetical protein R3356_03905 [Eudoraea sp.]|nr:hypothetical protein [Eudoraea sp.]